MSRRTAGALLLALLCWAQGESSAAPYPNTSNFGVPFSEDEPWHRECMRVAGRSAAGSEAGKTPAPRCDASKLYYSKRSQAVTSPAEWRQVRECALASQDDAVLMMLYANGFGVPKDKDIAIHHACKLEFIAKAEMEGRIAHLAAARPDGEIFDQCDHVTSSHMGIQCTAIRAGQEERVREARLRRLERQLSPPGREAYRKLRLAAGRYARAAAGETDMRGTLAPAFAMEREDKVQAGFVRTLFDVLDKALPAPRPGELARADRQLNARYQALMHAPSSQDGHPGRIGDSTIARDDVRQTEREWIAYRDSFLAFRAALPSGSSMSAIRLALTRQRLAELNRLMRYRE